MRGVALVEGSLRHTREQRRTADAMRSLDTQETSAKTRRFVQHDKGHFAVAAGKNRLLLLYRWRHSLACGELV
jgi:hypothetical protein